MFYTALIFPIALAGIFAGPTLDPVVPKSTQQFDQHLGWSLKPSSEGTSNRTGVPIAYHIDSQGFRFIDNHGANPECGVVALGESNTFGFAISEQDHWLTRLRENLPSLKVYNLGVSGFGLDQMLLRFRKSGASLRPKLVLLYIVNFNAHRHMRHYVFGGAKPYFEVTPENTLILHDDYIRQHVVGWQFVVMSVEQIADWIGLYRLFRAFSLTKAVRLIQELRHDVEAAGGRLVLISEKKELCTKTVGIECIETGYLGCPVITASGENLFHVNAEGSKKLAGIIADGLIRDHVLPDECLPHESKKTTARTAQ